MKYLTTQRHTLLTQQQKNCLFFNNHHQNTMRYQKVLPGNIVTLHSLISNGLLLVFETFELVTMDQLRHYVIATLALNTLSITVIHGGYSNLGYTNKEVLSTYDR